MASPPQSPLSSSGSPYLGKECLNEVLELLKKCGFPEKRWFELGLALGLSKNTLDTIEANYPRDVHRCLIECLSKWLERADAVDSKGGATWDSLSTGLRSMKENAVVDILDQEIQKRSQVLAIGIFDRHHPVLFESLSDPVNIAWLLYADKVISQQLLSNVEADYLSLAGQRQVLLNAIREAVKTNHIHLQTFAIVLGKFRHNAKLGDDILKDYGIKFPSNEDIEIVQVEESAGISCNETNGTASPSPKIVEIPVLRSMSEDFSFMRTSYATMSCNVRKAIKATKVDLDDLKDFIISCDSSLEGKIDHCDTLSSVLRLVDKECSLVNITLFCGVVEHFKVAEAKEYVEEYRTKLNKFIHSVSITLCLKERFEADDTCPPLKCETITYVFDWQPDDERKLNDIKDILSKTSGKLVKIKFMDTGNSIIVTCSFPYSHTGVLIVRLVENLQLLKKFDLIRLTIGYLTLWEKEKKREEVEQLLEQKTSPKEEHKKWEQITEESDDEKAIALTKKEDLSISEYKRKYEETLKLKKGMTFEIEVLRFSLKTKEADHLERSKEVAMLQEKISVTHMQLLNKEEEIKKLEKDNRSLKRLVAKSSQSLTNIEGIPHYQEVGIQVGIQVDSIVITSRDMLLYTGVMYHEQKTLGHWKTYYTVVRDLDILKQHLESNHEGAEYDDVVDSFTFVQPNGCLQLLVQTPQEPGWTVNPDREPLELLQSRVDEFPSTPSYSTCSMSVYAKPGIAQDLLHCPIKLTGIDPETTIYINRTPPPPPSIIDNTTSTSSTTGASPTSRETEESTFRPNAAYEVMTENIAVIKSQEIDLQFLADKLFEKEIINARQKKEVTDELTGHSVAERTNKLLEFLMTSISVDREDFGIFLEILKEEGTKRCEKLAKKLMDAYNEKLK